ncbi:MAG: multicopper oxidase domain-containing protein [Thermomicrobiales bacterium]|nr:multicopper oxidase domain-containing protein [Thermomicrobiales bacterium]
MQVKHEEGIIGMLRNERTHHTRRRLLGAIGVGTAGAALAGYGLTDLLEAAAQGTPTGDGGRARTYYLAAEEVNWDYAPSGRDLITGEPFDETADVFVGGGEDRIGRVYRKALYRAYTDDTFTTPAAIDPAWSHLGFLGPVIRAEVGDTLEVVFRNTTTRPASVHPHGVFYTKENEGARYADGSPATAQGDDIVAPGDTYTYHWPVPERAGPGPHDPSSIVWMYHSHVDTVADTNAGLVGPILVTRRGEARADGSPRDIDREFVTLFSVTDENASSYLEENIRTFTSDPESVDPDDEDFVESNLMHGINGFVFGNLPGLEMRLGERVRWYAVGMGTEVDLHTPHWHGATLLWMGMRTDMTELLPMSMKTLDMVPDSPGVWLYHCHVNDHITAGMQALFTISG